MLSGKSSEYKKSAGAFDCIRGILLFCGSTRNLGGRAAWGRVCGRAKLLAGTLRCLHLCWRLPWDWSDEGQLGRCPKPHKGRCPLTLQGADEKGRSPPLDPFSRLSWSRFHAPSACSFLALRLSPCLLPQLSVKNLFGGMARHSSRTIITCICRSSAGITHSAKPPSTATSRITSTSMPSMSNTALLNARV